MFLKALIIIIILCVYVVYVVYVVKICVRPVAGLAQPELIPVSIA